jgi:hypothetical protein
MRLPGAGVADQTQRMPGLDPVAGRKLVKDRRAHRGVRLEVELLYSLVSREAGVVDAATCAPPVTVVAFGHHQLGEEAEVG